MANRRRLTEAQEQQLAADYLAGVGGQVVLGRKYGISPGTVKLVLKRQGVAMRTAAKVNVPKVAPECIVALFDEGTGMHAIGEALGVSYSTVRKYVLAAGREMRPRERVTYTFDRAFFDTVDTLRAYWAGFTAADGNLVKNTVRFGLGEKDRILLERLRVAARLEQPIRVETRSNGRRYVHLDITCPEWIAALDRHYSLVEVPRGKAGHLVGPDLPNPALRWAFLRGYYDGDGSTTEGGALSVSSTSRVFLAWVETVTGKASSDYGSQIRYGIRDGRAAEVAPLLYAGSTPETRLARKYDRARRWF